ncbi:probable cytochrome P450 28d1 [Fopius arisanus]|uniref:Cyp28d1_1 protein n=1 Tax=Fopius arisanus TaxID=64838 RepID=A0A0C9Q2T5_9HYME|nr:PREDICTED: probable cytochrome P450 28d1 [Fopius arisanus]
MELMCIVTTALIAVIFALLYRYLTANYGYWQERRILVPSGIVPGFGHMLPTFTMKKSVAEMMEDIHKAFPKSSMVGIYMLRKPVLVVRDAELVKTVLQTEFNNFRHHQTLDNIIDPLMDQNPFFLNDQKWKDARSVLLSTMTSKKLKTLSLVLRDGCSKFVKYLNNQLEGKQSIDVEGKPLFKRVTVEVSANAVLSVEEGMFNDDSPKIFKSMMETIFVPSTLQTLKGIAFFFFPMLNTFFGTSFVPQWVSKRFTKIVNNLIDERENGMTKREDVLQHLTEYCAGKNLSRSSVISNVFSFFLESYETSTLTMSFLACDLAKYPEVQSKVRKEIETVASRFGGEVSYEAISEMTYLDQVISESTRLHPIAGALRKFCSEETELVGSDGLRHKMKPGDEVMLSIYGLHKDPDYWDRPDEFRPERFDKESQECKQRHNYVFLPFSEGPRQCPGMRMAMLVVKMVFVNILRNFVIEKSPKLREPIVLDPMSLMPYIKGGAWIRLRRLH